MAGRLAEQKVADAGQRSLGPHDRPVGAGEAHAHGDGATRRCGVLAAVRRFGRAAWSEGLARFAQPERPAARLEMDLHAADVDAVQLGRAPLAEVRNDSGRDGGWRELSGGGTAEDQGDWCNRAPGESVQGLVQNNSFSTSWTGTLAYGWLGVEREPLDRIDAISRLLHDARRLALGFAGRDQAGLSPARQGMAPGQTPGREA